MKICWILLLAMTASFPLAAEPPKPAVVEIADNERVVHLIGSAFGHTYYEPRLETHLLQIGAHRGLVYRRVNVDTTSQVLEDLDGRVLIHKPTIVIFQAGSDDLMKQFRRQTFDFSVYPKAIDPLVQKLCEKNIRVVLCSVPPLGNGSTRDKLLPPNDGLKTWVDAARDTAKKHGAAFADLFTEALEWPMIGNTPTSRYYYDPPGHEKSWRLLLSQVAFVPARPPEALFDAKTGAGTGVDVANLKTDGKATSFSLRPPCTARPFILKIKGLQGPSALFVADKQVAAGTAEEWAATGVDLSSHLQASVDDRTLKEEFARGHAASATLSQIHNYTLPKWATVADFEAQKAAALKRTLDALAAHDAAVAKMVAAKPFAVRVVRQEGK